MDTLVLTEERPELTEPDPHAGGDCDWDTTDCPGCATGEAHCTCGQRPICLTHHVTADRSVA